MNKKKVKIPMAAVKEIKRLQWQIGEIMKDNEGKDIIIKTLTSENYNLKEELNRYVQPN